MALSTKCFTQSLRLLDPVNQKRIKLKQRILWPDYETLHLLNTFQENADNTNTQMELSNLFMYCPFQQNFTVKKTNKNDYLNLNQLYSDQFTHAAFWKCKPQSQSKRREMVTDTQENSNLIGNRRQKSLQKVYQRQQKAKTTSQQIYIILCKRPIAIDQIVKTPHKVCISVAPLSSEKFLWGGALHYEQFESFEQNNKKQESGLFKTGGQSFGFKIDSKPSFTTNSYRKSNGLIDKRQQRYSNYFKAQKQEQKQFPQIEKVRKQCSNKLKIMPQHIRQHQEMLYIQIDLTNNTLLPQKSDQYRFVSVDIYGRHLKPKYGGVYDRQSSSSDSDNEFNELKGALNKYKKLLKQEIFLIYSMPFMEFNSYLQSQLNYQESQQLRQINFRGSCSMFSAMKKLELKTINKSQQSKDKKQGQRRSDSFEQIKKQRFVSIQQQKPFIKQDKSIKREIQIKEKEGIDKNSLQSIQQQIIQILPEPFNFNNKYDLQCKDQLIRKEKNKIVISLCKRFTKIQKSNQNESQEKEIYVPVFNAKGFQPLRIGVDRRFMLFLNPQIQKLTTKVFVQSERIKKGSQNEERELNDKSRKRLSVYVGKQKGRQKEQRDLIGIDVFLTDKVYRQQTVYLMIDILRQIEILSRSIDLEMIDLGDILEISSIQEFQKILILLKDIKGSQEGNYCDEVRYLLWIVMLQKVNRRTEKQLKLIKQVQQQAYLLIQQTDEISLNNNQKQDHINKQQQIITKIKDYHNQFTQNTQQSELFIKLFFQFFKNHPDQNNQLISYLTTNNNKINTEKDQKNLQNQLNPIIYLFKQIFNHFLLVNCKVIIQNNSLQLSKIIEKLSLNISKHDQNHNSFRNHQSILCKLLKSAVTFTVQHLSSIPINIFLSQPLQWFDQQHYPHQQKSEIKSQQIESFNKQVKPVFGYNKLRRFLKKYFIKGHNYLDRQANQNFINADNIHMSLITDLLNLYIQLTNIEKSQPKHISNVIQLINDQYSNCLITNQSVNFEKIINNQNGFQTTQVLHFDKNQKDSQISISIQKKYQQILKQKDQWKLNSFSFLVNSYKNINQQKQMISINNKTKPISFSENTNESPKYLFDFNLQQKYSQNTFLQLSITFAQINPLNETNENFIKSDSYSIDLVKTHLGLNYSNNQHFLNNNKSLFTCYQVFVEVQITTNKSIPLKQKIQTKNQQSSTVNDVTKLNFKGSNLLTFQNFNNSQITKNQINLNLTNQQKEVFQCNLSNIHKIDIKIFSKKLPILAASLSFINLRLGKYFKNILKKTTSQTSRKSTNRKTIGGRYTQHINGRKSVLPIEQNIFFGQSQRKPKNSKQISTLFDLPENLLFDLLLVDKSYIQDEEKILYFVDEFYQRNQPQFEDYLLYLCVRPNFIRISTILKHYFNNKLKYEDSKILTSFIKTKLSSSLMNNENTAITQMIIGKPRISSIQPLKNILDTNEQRQLLNKYMKDLTRKNSLHKNEQSQSLSKKNLFSKKSIFQITEQRKQNCKDIKDIEI